MPLANGYRWLLQEDTTYDIQTGEPARGQDRVFNPFELVVPQRSRKRLT
jgi:hypothetical protein